jgi:para-aminobenzoate synthetase component 1
MVHALACWQETDVLFSGEGFSDDTSVCGCMPSEIFTITENTNRCEIKDFVFSGGTVLGCLNYGEILGTFKKYSLYLHHKNGEISITAESEKLLEKASEIILNRKPRTLTAAKTNVTCNTSKDEYISKVKQVLDCINSGECYQLNLSVMYEAQYSGNPIELWLTLAAQHPAPFMSFFTTPEGTVVSASPERFIRCSDGYVLSQPIKGTCSVTDDAQEAADRLTASLKESAELSMIVDMVRNDISPSCKIGSVSVKNHKSLMRVGNLLQMYSSVHGELKDDKDVIDLLLDAFPGASVTGCPKKQAMTLIDSLEPHDRGVYCGSMVMIEDEKNMDSSILIRTGFHSGGLLRFYAGSGIVADSSPESEYLETISKAEKFMRLLT